jgi:threonyl-tRNA synthetase
MKGWSERDWLYKAYGIFQYDIQAITEDETFFANKLWYSFDECLNRLMKELNSKLKIANGDVWLAVQRYNGAGQAAINYMNNVKQFNQWIS